MGNGWCLICICWILIASQQARAAAATAVGHVGAAATATSAQAAEQTRELTLESALLATTATDGASPSAAGVAVATKTPPPATPVTYPAAAAAAAAAAEPVAVPQLRSSAERSIMAMPAPCLNSPGPPTTSLPPGAEWQCSTETPDGSSCAAGCQPGYFQASEGSLRIFCAAGLWANVQSSGSLDCVLVEPSCQGPPSSDFLPTGGIWQCNGAPEGGTCTATCDQGYQKQGSLTALCSEGNWGAAASTLTCTPTAAPCSNTPGPSTAGLPANTRWSCTGASTNSGGSCVAVCDPWFTGASTRVVSCLNGFWQPPQGTITCNLVPPSPCDNSPGPSTVGMPANALWSCTGASTSSGGSCGAVCEPGFIGASTRIVSCFNGIWQPSQGTITCETDPASICKEPPSLSWLPVGGKWGCSGGAHGAGCSASCDAGYDVNGTLTVQCNLGQWQNPTSSITCSPSGCRTNPGPLIYPNATWNCSPTAAHGDKCIAAGCNGATKPTDPPVAICDFGSWVYSRGSCAGESTKIYYLTVEGPESNMFVLADDVLNGVALMTANNILSLRQSNFALYNPALAAFNFTLLSAWISQSLSNTRRRQLLVQQGQDQIVIGVQVFMGQGIIAKTAETIVDAAMNTPTAMSYFIAQGLDVARDKQVDEGFLQQISLGVSDSTGRPLGASAGADSCLAQFIPSTPVNTSAGIISAYQSSSVSTVTVCGGADTLFTTFTYLASSTVANDTTLEASITNDTATTCSVTPDKLPGNANNSTVTVACRKTDGSAFTAAATYEVLLAANFTCSDQRSLTVATTNVQTVERPRLTLRLGRQPPPGCGGKPAVAIIRYNLRGLQDGQDFDLAAQVGPNCTAQLNPRPTKANGVAVVTCSGAFTPGEPVPVTLNLTATVQGCGDVSGFNSTNVSVDCCTTGSSYARLNSSRTNKPTCFQHTRPGYNVTKCAKPVNASGYFNQGPGSGSLFVARNADSCSAALAVGEVNVTCPQGGSANKISFRIVTPAAYRSSERRYMLSCSAPTSSTECPGKPFWISVKAKPGRQGTPEGLTSTVVNGHNTVEFNVTTRCSCSSVYHGLVDFAYYKGLPVSACRK